MNKQKLEFRMGVGASSILMVLVVLVLTALSMLSFSSARNAQVLTRRNLAMTTAYYQAAAEAQWKLAAVNEAMAECESGGGAITDEILMDALRKNGLGDISLTSQGQETAFAFSVDAGYDRTLEVAGTVAPAGSPRYRVTRHEVVSQYMGGDIEYYDFLLGE